MEIFELFCSESVIKEIKQNKIPCYVVAFFEFNNFKKTMECLLKKNEFLDIKVIENNSKYSETKFKPYILDLIKQGKVSEYFLFDNNVCSGIAKTLYPLIAADNNPSPYKMFTDGDLTIEEKNWLEEEIAILEQNEEVYAVGVDLSLDNLPNIEGADKWVPPARVIEGKNYAEGYTGGWFWLFRKNDFADVINHIKNNDLRYVDVSFHRYCTRVLNKKWARTKIAKARHLTWDNYVDPNDEYTIWKASIPFQEHWQQDKNCGYNVYTIDGEKYYDNREIN